MDTKTTDDECMELKNIKYKTMLMSGTSIQESRASADMDNLHAFLENEKNTNQSEPWCKLDKTIKTQKLVAFADKYKEEQEYDDVQHDILVKYLKDCLNKKRLAKQKDVVYDKVEGVIKEIPALTYNTKSNQFTLKRTEKRVSTLKSLPPNKSSKIVTKSKKPVIRTTRKNSTIDSLEDTED